MEAKNIFNLLLTKFDHIYLLTLSHRKDRQYGIMQLLYDLGYDENNISHLKKFSIIYTTTWKYNGLCANAANTYFKQYCFTKPNEYDCTRNHYNIIKTAYDLGYERILIMEDDIRFMQSDMLTNFINNFPTDYSLVQLQGFTVNPTLPDLCRRNLSENNLYFSYTGNIWCTGLYALSREGMLHYIDATNKLLSVADMPLYKHPDKGYYISAYPLAIQADHDDVSSDIRDKSNDKINYNKQNTYEQLIDKTNYITYPIID